MDHAGAADFEPARVFAETTAFAIAGGAGDVDFEPRLNEGKIAGTETGLHLCVEQFAEEFVHRGKEVGEGDVFIDVEAFDLMEEDVRAAADGFIAVDGARGDDADGWFMFFHDAELGIGGVGAEEHVFGDVESILHVAGWMVGREVQAFVVVVVAVDVWAVLHGKAHADEDFDDFIEGLIDGVFPAKVAAAAWECDVDLFFSEAFCHFQLGKAVHGLFAETGDFFFELVDLLADEGACLRRGVAEVQHEVLNGAFFAEVFDFELFNIFAVLNLTEFVLKFFAKRRDLVFHEDLDKSLRL